MSHYGVNKLIIVKQQEFAWNNDIEYYVEVSAKTGEGVKDLFDTLLAKITERWERRHEASGVKRDYEIRVTSTARNTSENVPCCNIF